MVPGVGMGRQLNTCIRNYKALLLVSSVLWFYAINFFLCQCCFCSFIGLNEHFCILNMYTNQSTVAWEVTSDVTWNIYTYFEYKMIRKNLIVSLSPPLPTQRSIGENLWRILPPPPPILTLVASSATLP